MLANDTDLDGDSLMVASFGSSTSMGGGVSDNGNGTLFYQPPVDFIGTDTFTYTATDGHGGYASATVTVTVLQQPTVWMDAPASLMENGTGEFTLHRNRSEGELTVTLSSYDTTAEPGDYGMPATVTFAEGVTSLPVLFQAYDDADPDDELFWPSFSNTGGYAIGNQSCALVTILDDDPQSVWFDNSSATIIEPSSSGFSSSFELTLQRNTSEGELTVLYHVVGSAEAGDYTISPSDSVTFYDGQSSTSLWITPEDDDDGDDEQLGIQFEGDPAYMAGNSASITLEDREPPVATAKEYFSFGDGTAQGNLLTDDTGNGQDSDPNGDALTVETQPFTSPMNGSVTISANGDFTYTATPGFQGTDTFSYIVVDSDGLTAQGIIMISVVLYQQIDLAFTVGPGNTEETEESPGALIATNFNNDHRADPATITTVDFDGNGEITVRATDLEQPSSIGDDPDLVEIEVKQLPIGSTENWITYDETSLRIYKTRRPINEPGNVVHNGDQVQLGKYYVESRNAAFGAGLLISLKARMPAGNIFTDSVVVRPTSIIVEQVPEYLFADANYATPVRFTIDGLAFDEFANIEDIKISVHREVAVGRYEELMPHIPIEQRFQGGDGTYFKGERKENGETNTYTAYVDASSLKLISLGESNDHSSKVFFAVDATFSVVDADKNEVFPSFTAYSPYAPSIGVSGIYRNDEAYPTIFSDARVTAVDLQPPDADEFDFVPKQINIRETGSEQIQVRQNGVLDDYTLPYDTTAQQAKRHVDQTDEIEYHFDTIETDSHVPTGDVPDTVSVSARIEDATQSDLYIWGRGVAAAAPFAQIGGFYYVSYGGQEIAGDVLEPGELAMDLLKTSGNAQTNIFRGVTGRIEVEAVTKGLLTQYEGVKPFANLTNALLAGHPVAKSFKVATKLAETLNSLATTPGGDSASGAIIREAKVVHIGGAEAPDESWPLLQLKGTEDKTYNEATVGLSGSSQVYVGSQVVRVIRLHADAYAVSAYWSDRKAVSTVKLLPSDPESFKTFKILATYPVKDPPR